MCKHSPSLPALSQPGAASLRGFLGGLVLLPGLRTQQGGLCAQRSSRLRVGLRYQSSSCISSPFTGRILGCPLPVARALARLPE